MYLLIPALVSFLYGEESGSVFFDCQCVFLEILFLIFGKKPPEGKTIYGKEGFVIVGIAWILWSLFGALPFFLSGSIPNYLDAFFETVSGFTTTGSTILTDIEILPKGISFWRSLTHWIGGMGVLVFVMMLTSLEDDQFYAFDASQKFQDQKRTSWCPGRGIRRKYYTKCILS